MEKFKKIFFDQKKIPSDDKGIFISDLLPSIEGSNYYSRVLEYFDLNTKNNDFIPISGASTLLSHMSILNRRYKKIDFESSLEKVFFDYSKGFRIRFKKFSHPDFPNMDEILATPIHSGERDFFSNLYDIDRYAKKLISKGYGNILDQNLSMLKEKGEHIRKYRLIYDTENSEFYFRAIVSIDGYYNYDNDLTIVIALLKLYNEIKNTKDTYDLRLCEYNQSFIRLYFNTSQMRKIPSVGYLQNTLQVSNDETKREALRFSNVCTINFGEENKNQELFIKPKDIKSKILSITHGVGPEKAMSRLADFIKTKEVFDKLAKDVEKISTIKDPNTIIHLVREKVENATTEGIKKNRDELKKVLYKNVKTTYELLDLFNKLVHLGNLDIDAKDYLRYKIYEALVERK